MEKLESLLGLAGLLLKRVDAKADALTIGRQLFEAGMDEYSNGGFWIRDVRNFNYEINSWVEYFSPKLRQSLGFKGEKDFPSYSSSLFGIMAEDSMRTSLKNYEEAMNDENSTSYSQDIVCLTKNNAYALIRRTGIMVWLAEMPSFMIGFHKILQINESRQHNRVSRLCYSCLDAIR